MSSTMTTNSSSLKTSDTTSDNVETVSYAPRKRPPLPRPIVNPKFFDAGEFILIHTIDGTTILKQVN
jgi:hypothetical protein